MRVVVVYESMYGNTHLVADAIADGLRSEADVSVLPVDHADAAALADVDLVVVGGPTHVHGMTRASTRKAAAEAAQKPGSGLGMDTDAEGEGLREWFDSIGSLPRFAAAFDTRMHGPVTFTGRASKGIAKRLRRARQSAGRRTGELPRFQGDPSRRRRAGTRPQVGHDTARIDVGGRLAACPPAQA